MVLKPKPVSSVILSQNDSDVAEILTQIGDSVTTSAHSLLRPMRPTMTSRSHRSTKSFTA